VTEPKTLVPDITVSRPTPVIFHRQHTPVPIKAGHSAILLCTLNARYIHASLGLRYLYANMGELEKYTCLMEFTINERVIDVAEQLISTDPKIIGFGVYIWNVKQTTELIALIRKLRPQIRIVIGGPEVSYEYDNTPIFSLCNHLITGQADQAFPSLCNSHRVLYVEASRGCPFKCEFCLSALDKTAWPFNLESFLEQIELLYQRGARQFKFVDRTFNLKTATCTAILEFFLQRIARGDELFLHFEVIPDRLPDALKDLIRQFPPGSAYRVKQKKPLLTGLTNW